MRSHSHLEGKYHNNNIAKEEKENKESIPIVIFMKFDKISVLVLIAALVAIKTIHLPGKSRRKFSLENQGKISAVQIALDFEQNIKIKT